MTYDVQPIFATLNIWEIDVRYKEVAKKEKTAQKS